ncbi:MAG: hypothetical protein WAW61_11500 [Methylococcaceae bacterium]
MNLINRAHNATKFLNTHAGSGMDLTHEPPGLSSFISRLTKLQDKTKALLDKSSTDAFVTIDYEFGQLKREYQEMAGGDGNKSQTLFQCGQMLGQYESMLNEINPLKYI